jgi:phosphoglucosamine mutase
MTRRSTDYAAHLVATFEQPLAGLKVVLDCAEGAASVVGPKALRDAGADVIAIHADPDGLNINDNCGSTHLESLQAAVVEHGADAGFGLDGDCRPLPGDRPRGQRCRRRPDPRDLGVGSA